MTQAELHEQAARMTRGMNLVDMRFYTSNNGDVAEVLLKYHAPDEGPELLSDGIPQGLSLFDLVEDMTTQEV